MQALGIQSYTLVSALGRGKTATLAALRESRSGLRPCDLQDVDLSTWIGRVDGVEAVELPGALRDFDCRNNRLALLGLVQDGFQEAVAQVRMRLGAERIGVYIGTTSSGIAETEAAYRRRNGHTGALPADYRYRYTHNAFSVADFCRRYLGLCGPAQAVLTSCSSSAKVFGVAQRAMLSGLCDAAVIGGVDSLCLTTLLGFNALQLVSERPCRPWDAERNGLSIGEAAGFALLVRAAADVMDVYFLGYGESQDAYHMTAPEPRGAGAALAMRRALNCAGLAPSAIDYVNLHGTATPANDAAEDQAVVAVFGRSTPCSSTKGWTGHTLGAAGITEAVIACLAVEHGLIPASLNTQTVDTALHANIQLVNRACGLRRVMSNAFGFGGSNCALVLGTAA